LFVALELQVGDSIQMHRPACESAPSFVFDVCQRTETAERKADVMDSFANYGSHFCYSDLSSYLKKFPQGTESFVFRQQFCFKLQILYPIVEQDFTEQN
jgi:hypothetical protein